MKPECISKTSIRLDDVEIGVGASGSHQSGNVKQMCEKLDHVDSSI